jgi:hypothetical protein
VAAVQFIITQPGRHGADVGQGGLAADLLHADPREVHGDGRGAGVRET